uniref:Putative secreted protein n=1 Tax=Anopheles marajoara TaxID=58244 RepID=A0A2M4CE17_9DIPT
MRFLLCWPCFVIIVLPSRFGAEDIRVYCKHLQLIFFCDYSPFTCLRKQHVLGGRNIKICWFLFFCCLSSSF